ncbi:T9SS type A sorting domain-containing protein [Marinirhabdus gelatinilytica]|uniref:Putative secreted protein (Por secretion system target) n=1 Tax=Marinirhabdus gelatinilytica TaxID=1703343 RepID=A0A370QJL6_9FLAO|nr:T9SS type A sorting domain-containing protein [Marinirhabdus gelatinilytica]RDK88567.1 putative secreted protein (Por secretion system target) [Marinirhabdus gelatinilytica]
MKKYLIALLLVATQALFAQDPQLFENTWYLDELVINSETVIPPSTDEAQNAPLVFSESGSVFLIETTVCNLLFGEVVFDNPNPTFSFSSGPGGTTADCQNPINKPFENAYFDFFEDYAVNAFTYETTTSGTTKTLLITNANGDTALYGDEVLAIKDVMAASVLVFPNPVQEVLTVSANKTMVKEISIFNIQGQEVMTVKFQQKHQTIDVGSLKSGIYFLKAESGAGHTLTQKFVKE